MSNFHFTKKPLLLTFNGSTVYMLNCEFSYQCNKLHLTFVMKLIMQLKKLNFDDYSIITRLFTYIDLKWPRNSWNYEVYQLCFCTKTWQHVNWIYSIIYMYVSVHIHSHQMIYDLCVVCIFTLCRTGVVEFPGDFTKNSQ